MEHTITPTREELKEENARLREQNADLWHVLNEVSEDYKGHGDHHDTVDLVDEVFGKYRR